MRLDPFAAAAVDLGLAGLAAFRRQWVPKKHERAARLIYSGASGVFTAASGTEAYSGIEPVHDPRRERLVNAGVGLGAAVLTYASWPLINRFNDWTDAKLRGWGVKHPPLVSAAVSIGASTLMHAALLALDDELTDPYADWDEPEEVPIELPAHIREATVALLADEHAVDARTAAVLREQLATAEFWVMPAHDVFSDSSAGGDQHSDDQHSDNPLDWATTFITVQVPATAERVVPATQTYPVSGLLTAADGSLLKLSVETVDGRIASISLASADAGYPQVSPGLAEANDTEWSDVADEAFDAHFILRNWPRLAELEIVTDAQLHSRAKH